MANTFPAFLASLEQLKRRIEQGSADALKEHIDNVAVAANAPGVVPYDTGELHDSQFVEGPLVGAGKATVRLGYGAGHATLVHEQPQTARRTGISKWAETTITGKAGELGPILKAKVGL